MSDLRPDDIDCIINEAKDSSDWRGFTAQYTIVTWQDAEYRVTLSEDNTWAVITEERTRRTVAAKVAW